MFLAFRLMRFIILLFIILPLFVVLGGYFAIAVIILAVLKRMIFGRTMIKI